MVPPGALCSRSRARPPAWATSASRPPACPSVASNQSVEGMPLADKWPSGDPGVAGHAGIWEAGGMSAELIERFYAAFDRRDGVAMAADYAPEGHFRDPVFGDLTGAEAGA